jgi:AcrR family transcriptional regulator
VKATYHHGDLRRELLRQGLQLIVKEGMPSFSMRRLAQALGVSHAAAYRHFPNKEALLAAIFFEAMERFRFALASSVEGVDDPEEALMRLGIAYVRFFVTNPEVLSLFNSLPGEDVEIGFLGPPPEADCAPRADPHAGATEGGAYALFARVALRAPRSGAQTRLDDGGFLLGYWAKVHGLSCLIAARASRMPPDALEATIDRLVRTPF